MNKYKITLTFTWTLFIVIFLVLGLSYFKKSNTYHSADKNKRRVVSQELAIKKQVIEDSFSYTENGENMELLTENEEINGKVEAESLKQENEAANNLSKGIDISEDNTRLSNPRHNSNNSNGPEPAHKDRNKDETSPKEDPDRQLDEVPGMSEKGENNQEGNEIKEEHEKPSEVEDGETSDEPEKPMEPVQNEYQDDSNLNGQEGNGEANKQDPVDSSDDKKEDKVRKSKIQKE